jgi:hypothetical protein
MFSSGRSNAGTRPTATAGTALYADDVVYEGPGGARISGLEDLKEKYFDALAIAAPDRASRDVVLFAEGDHVVEQAGTPERTQAPGAIRTVPRFPQPERSWTFRSSESSGSRTARSARSASTSIKSKSSRSSDSCREGRARPHSVSDSVPEVVRQKAFAVGARAWLDDLPLLVASLEHDWNIAVGDAYTDSTEAFVAKATCEDGTTAVLKLLVPRSGDAAENEITVLRLTRGQGCVRLLRDDPSRGALLLERLGRSLYELGLPIGRRHEILCSTVALVWRPAPAAACRPAPRRVVGSPTSSRRPGRN